MVGLLLARSELAVVGVGRERLVCWYGAAGGEEGTAVQVLRGHVPVGERALMWRRPAFGLVVVEDERLKDRLCRYGRALGLVALLCAAREREVYVCSYSSDVQLRQLVVCRAAPEEGKELRLSRRVLVVEGRMPGREERLSVLVCGTSSLSGGRGVSGTRFDSGREEIDLLCHLCLQDLSVHVVSVSA